MARSRHAVATYPARIVGACLACILNCAVAWADDAEKLHLTLTKIELEAVITRYQKKHGFSPEGFLEEVAVKATPMQLNFRDQTQDVWGGVAAPFWALFHPKESWRILLPIPPKEPVPSTSDPE